jgi:hypothetical protein
VVVMIFASTPHRFVVGLAHGHSQAQSACCGCGWESCEADGVGRWRTNSDEVGKTVHAAAISGVRGERYAGLGL